MDEQEALWETIVDYQKLAQSILLQREQLNRAGVSMGREKKLERLLKLERKVNRVFRLMQTSDLTDLETAFLDNIMDGHSISQVSQHLGFTRSTGSKKLRKIIDKMLSSEG